MVKFPMPEISYDMGVEIARRKLKETNFWLADAREDGILPRAGPDIAKACSAEYEAWVSWLREKWPKEESPFMIQNESKRYGARIPFTPGKDHWVHDGTRWNVEKLTTKRKGTK